MNSRKLSIAAVSLLSLGVAASTAMAQPADGEVAVTTSYDSTYGTTPVVTSEPAPAASTSAAKWGVGTTFPTGGDGQYANFLMNLSADNWLNLGVSVRIDKAGEGADTVFGIGARAGYRMYRAQVGRVRPYIEPFIGVDIGDAGEAGDTLGLLLGAQLGVSFQVMDQFTLGAGVGMAAGFGDSFKSVSISTYTPSLNATFWW